MDAWFPGAAEIIWYRPIILPTLGAVGLYRFHFNVRPQRALNKQICATLESDTKRPRKEISNREKSAVRVYHDKSWRSRSNRRATSNRFRLSADPTKSNQASLASALILFGRSRSDLRALPTEKTPYNPLAVALPFAVVEKLTHKGNNEKAIHTGF